MYLLTLYVYMLQRKEQAVYLGGLLSTDGRATGECTRRLGEAGRTFQALTCVWKHAHMNIFGYDQSYNLVSAYLMCLRSACAM